MPVTADPSAHGRTQSNPQELRFGLERLPFAPLAEWILDMRGLQQLWNRAKQLDEGLCVFDRLLRALNVTVHCSPSDLARIPESGAAVLVANHPHGLLDGLIAGSLLSRRRTDFRVLANSILSQIDEVAPYVIPVDVFGGDVHRNGVAARAALRWLQRGGATVAFPAGEVSAVNGLPPRVTDRPWSSGPLQLARRVDAKLVPVFIAGQNSLSFQMAGVAHPDLRTLLLGRELLNKRGNTIRVAVGQPISSAGDERLNSDYLRRRTYVLSKRAHAEAPRRTSAFSPQPVAAPQDSGELARNVAALGRASLLYSARDYEVYLAPSRDLPIVLPEIGRLRELFFRAAGEGTGKASDLDRFDNTYEHLFLWNRDRREIVGAYRLGLVSRVTETEGANGLYTHTLFRFGGRFLRQVMPGVELGRSFVRAEYQRNPHALSYLWRGIGAYIARHPEVLHLFGPVSISSDYRRASRELIVEYFRHSHSLPLAVNARDPFRLPLTNLAFRPFIGSIGDLTELSAAVSDLESDGKGIPVLLRHYLNLGARIVAFNVDKSFADALDALIVVSLVDAPARTLARYMGQAELAAWRTLHGVNNDDNR